MNAENGQVAAAPAPDELWHRKSTFVLAAVGSAVGLGNIWRFPYALGENGGSAFLLLYLFCVFAICVPVLLAESLIGRVGRGGPLLAFSHIAARQGSGSRWVVIGFMGIAGSFIIGGFYPVVGGWATAYSLRSLWPGFPSTEAEIAGFFQQLTSANVLGIDWLEILMHTLFLAMCLLIIYQGVVKGLERYLRPLIPLLAVLMGVAVFYALSIGNVDAALAFLFSPDFSKINGQVLLAAMGHAFFSLSLGMGVFITFGSYTPSDLSLGRTVALVGFVDTAVAVLAGLVVFPLVFAVEGLVANAGPGLVFQSIPLVFAQMPLGEIARAMFFILLLVAALTSMVSIIEPAVSALEHYRGFTRHQSATIVVVALWFFATICAESGAFFNLLDYLTTKIILPVGGMLIALFVGWRLRPDVYADQQGMPSGNLYILWIWILRLFAPAAIALVLVAGIWPS